MITKERLEELIEKGATIYSYDVWSGNISSYVLYGEYQIINNKLYQKILNGKIAVSLNPLNYLMHLYETKANAEEYAEFGNIIRTDTLKFPIWEDIKDKGYDEIFFVKDNRFDSGVVQYYFLVAEQTKQIQIMFREIEHIMTIDAYDVIFSKPLTRENYNEARRLCKKLFLGENDE